MRGAGSRMLEARWGGYRAEPRWHTAARRRRRGILTVGLACGALLGCRSYQAADPKVRPVPDSVMQTEDRLFIRLLPEQSAPGFPGVVFYPGGFVAPDAYVTPLSRVAEEGHPVIIA